MKTPPLRLVKPSGASSHGWHEHDSYARCHKEYQFEQIRKIKKPQANLPDPLATGLGFHAGRARWFTLKFPKVKEGNLAWKSIVQAVEEECARQELPSSLKAVQRAMQLINLYTEYWALRPLPKVLAAELTLDPTPLIPGDQSILFRSARLDDVSIYPEAGNRLWLGEAKTTSDTPNEVFKTYELHGQILTQMALWRSSPQGASKYGPIAGVMLDVIRKPNKSQTPAFARIPIPVSDFAINWHVKELRDQLDERALLTWNTDAERNVTACRRTIAGRYTVDCPYKLLCRDGKTAASIYVYENGKALTSFKPDEERKVMPWE